MKEELQKILNDFNKKFCFIYLSLKRKHKLQLQELTRLKRSQNGHVRHKANVPLFGRNNQTYDFAKQFSNDEIVSLQWRPKDSDTNAA